MLFGFLKAGFKISLFLAAMEVALAGVLMMSARLRGKRRGEPREPFPREEQPEIKLESSDERFKLYLDYEGLYEENLSSQNLNIGVLSIWQRSKHITKPEIRSKMRGKHRHIGRHAECVEVSS